MALALVAGLRGLIEVSGRSGVERAVGEGSGTASMGRVAFAPIIASSLLIVTGGSWAISPYIALMALVSLLCLFFLSETHLTDIPGMREEERDLLAERGVVPK